jgi:outer membrane protein assembly factor BamB
MKRFTCVGLALALAITAATAQDRNIIWSSASAPPREALDRLNLTLAWRAAVQTETRRDTLMSVQLTGRQLLVQTRSGLVTALDAETGHTLWRSRFGRAYQRPLPLAHNRKAIFVVNGTSLFGLDRETGAQEWEVNLPDGVSSPPVAGEHQVYVGLGSTKLLAYLLPQSEQTASLATADRVNKNQDVDEPWVGGYPAGTLARDPVLSWQSLTTRRLEWTPMLGPDCIAFATPEGDVFGMEKFPIRSRQATERYHVHLTDDGITVPPGHYEDMAYIGSRDANVYALAIDSGRVVWRFAGSTPIVRQPIATEKDVYVVSQRVGLARVDRATGRGVWHLSFRGADIPSNTEADRFLAANPKFVYATDASGRLLVLDRATGTRLSIYEGTRDFTVSFSNAVNDRIYLADNNGLIVCLHDRDYATPFRHTRGDDRAIDPDEAEVAAKLSKQITSEGAEPTKLSVFLKELLGEKNGNIKYLVSLNAFKEANILDIEDRPVQMPRVTRVPLGEVLRRALASVDANYRIYKDTVLIFPLAKKATPMP